MIIDNNPQPVISEGSSVAKNESTAKAFGVPTARAQHVESPLKENVVVSAHKSLTALAMSLADPARVDRVRDLATQYQSGQYSVDKLGLSRRMAGALLHC